MGAVEEDVDRRGLQRDLGRLLNKYRGLPIKEIRAAELVADITPIAFRHRLRLPADLWLLGKTLSMLEGLGMQLDPEFDIFGASEPIIRRLGWRLLMPKRSLRLGMIRRRTELAEMMEMLPRAADRFLRQAERGDLFSVRLKDLDAVLGLLDRLATRLSISLVIAALILGTAALIPSTAGNVVARALTIAGFVFSVAMGVWLVISMGLPRRRR